MPRRFVLAIAIFGLTTFVSCSPHGRDSSKSPLSAAPTQPTQANLGTVDSGGGNTYMGKPLESYVVDPTHLSAYKEFLGKFVESSTLSSEIKLVLTRILKNKVWYMIPGELRNIHAEKIGSAVGVDQAALQDFQQVWINQNIFDKMNSADQALLIVHELMMGFRLLYLDSARSECLAYEGPDLDHCIHLSEKVRGKPSDLNAADYADIRFSAREVFDRISELKGYDWMDLLARYNFKGSYIIFTPKTSEKNIKASEIAELLENSKSLGFWPQYGFDFNKLTETHPEILSDYSSLPKTNWNSDTSCAVDLTIKDGNIALKLSTSERSISTSGNIYETPLTLMKDPLEGTYYSFLSLPRLSSDKDLKKGSLTYSVNISFSGKSVRKIYIFESMCLNETCSDSSLPKNGLNLTCATTASLILNPQGAGPAK
jgi:hypothetical protein